MPIDHYAASRKNMVDGQVLTNKVLDADLVQAMRAVPREQFVPEALRNSAYVDDDIHVGHGRYLIEPMVFARMVQAADIRPSDTVLDIGCATGYSLGVLSRLAKHVVGLEENEELWQRAQLNVTSMRMRNVELVGGRLTSGCEEKSPYDVILLEGAVEEIPHDMTQQLAESGRLIAVVRKRNRPGHAWLYHRTGNTVAQTCLFDAQIAFLPGFDLPKAFRL